MKTQVTLSTLLLSLLMFVLVSCSDSGTNAKVPQDEVKTLVGTRWKLKSIIDVVNNKEKVPFPELTNNNNDTSKYFSIHFINEDEMDGHSSANECEGSYTFYPEEKKITWMFINHTKVGETPFGYEYLEIMRDKIKNSKCEFLNGTMKIYYDNETKYLLFNKLTPKIEKN